MTKEQKAIIASNQVDMFQEICIDIQVKTASGQVVTQVSLFS